MPDFKTYAWLDSLFPQSLDLKLLVVGLVGANIPMLAMIGYFFAAGDAHAITRAEILILLAGTVIGSLVTMIGLHLVLKPIDAATEALRLYEAERVVTEFPTGHADKAGMLLTSVHTLIQTVEVLLHRQERAAVADPLTGLANRRGFRDGLERALAEAGPGPCALIAVDIDMFKAVNDTHGHLVGDLVLADVAGLLAAAVQGDEVVARWGGEEFLMFLPAADRAAAMARATTVCAAIASHRFEHGRDLRITASAGVAIGDRGRFDFASLYDRADRALYRAKAGGRNQVTFADAEVELVQPEDGVDWAAA